MSISIASAPTAAVSEPSRSEILFPSYVREGGFEIVRLIKSYYDYLNQEGMPSHEIHNMVANHDIDVVSDKYLTAIQLEVAKSVPESTVLDKRRLYKIVSQYYKTRGSEQSVNSFFRIFFDEMVSVFYPSSEMFDTSGDKSQSSSRFVIQDGDYWQKYSYEIKTKNDATAWKNPFLKFVHPAGLKLFISILVIMYVDNTWEGPLEDYIDSLQSITAEEYWKNINLDVLIGRHSPKFQPGTSYTVDYLFKVIIDSEYHYRTQTYPINGVESSSLYAGLLSVFIDVLLLIDANISIFRSEYQEWLKFFDTAAISSYADKTIGDASIGYEPVNTCRFESLSTDATAYNNLEESYGDVVDIGSEAGFTNSSFTIDADDSTPDIPVYIPGYAPELHDVYISDVISELQYGVDSRLAGKSASTAKKLFVNYNIPDQTIGLRNASVWCADLSAITCMSPMNSYSGYSRAGTLISPCHIILSSHFAIPNGYTIKFVTMGNIEVAKTIVSQYAIPNTDLTIAKLNSDVPGTILFAKVFPSGLHSEIIRLMNAGTRIPAMRLDQEEKATVGDAGYEYYSSIDSQIAFSIPTDSKRLEFYEPVIGFDSGNPAFWIYDTDLIILTVWHRPDAGSGSSVHYYRDEINAAMTNLGGGYQLTEVTV